MIKIAKKERGGRVGEVGSEFNGMKYLVVIFLSRCQEPGYVISKKKKRSP